MSQGQTLSQEEELALKDALQRNVTIRQKTEQQATHNARLQTATKQNEEQSYLERAAATAWGVGTDLGYQALEMGQILTESALSFAGVEKVKDKKGNEGWVILNPGQDISSDSEGRPQIVENQYQKDTVHRRIKVDGRTATDRIGKPFKIPDFRAEESPYAVDNFIRQASQYMIAAPKALGVAKGLNLSSKFLTGTLASAMTSFAATSSDDATLGNMVVDFGIMDRYMAGATNGQKKVVRDYLTTTEEDSTLGAKAQIVLQDLMGEAAAIGVFKGLKAAKNTKKGQALIESVKGKSLDAFGQASDTANTAASAIGDVASQAGGIIKGRVDEVTNAATPAIKEGIKKADEALTSVQGKIDPVVSKLKAQTDPFIGAASKELQGIKKAWAEANPDSIDVGAYSKGLAEEIDSSKKAFHDWMKSKGIGEKMKKPLEEIRKETSIDPIGDAVAKETAASIEAGGKDSVKNLLHVLDDNKRVLKDLAEGDTIISKSFKAMHKDVVSAETVLKASNVGEDYAAIALKHFMKLSQTDKYYTNAQFDPKVLAADLGIIKKGIINELERKGGAVNLKSLETDPRSLLHGIGQESTSEALKTTYTFDDAVKTIKENGFLDNFNSADATQIIRNMEESIGAMVGTRLKMSMNADNLLQSTKAYAKEVKLYKGDAVRVNPSTQKVFLTNVLRAESLKESDLAYSRFAGTMMRYRRGDVLNSETIKNAVTMELKNDTPDVNDVILSISERRGLEDALTSSSNSAPPEDLSRKIGIIYDALVQTEKVEPRLLKDAGKAAEAKLQSGQTLSSAEEGALKDAKDFLKTQTAIGDRIEKDAYAHLANNVYLKGVGQGLETLVRWMQNGYLTSPAMQTFNYVNGGLQTSKRVVETLLASFFDSKVMGGAGVIQKDEAIIRIAHLFTIFPDSIMAMKQAGMSGTSKYGVFKKFDDTSKGLSSLGEAADMYKNADDWVQKAMVVFKQTNEAGFRASMTLDEHWAYNIEGLERIGLAHRYATHITKGGGISSHASLGGYDEIVKKLYHGDSTDPRLLKYNLQIDETVQDQKRKLLFANGLMDESSWLTTNIGGSEESLSSLFGRIRTFPALDKIFRIQVPFYNVAVNMMKEGVTHVPGMWRLNKQFYLARTGKLGSEALAYAKARQTLGALAFGSYFALSATNQMTGAVPSRQGARGAAFDDNFMPFSITDGDYYYQLRGSAPLDFVGKTARISYSLFEATAMAASLGFMNKQEVEASLEEQALLQKEAINHIAANIGGFFDGNPMTQGLGDMAALFGNNPSRTKRAQMNIAHALNPMESVGSGIRKWIADAGDNTVKDTKHRDFWTAYSRRALSRDLLGQRNLTNRVNIMGEPLLKQLQEWQHDRKGFDNLLVNLSLFLQGNTFHARPRSQDPVMRELARVEAEYTPPINYTSVRFDATTSHGVKTRKSHTYDLSQEQKKTWVDTTTSYVKSNLSKFIRSKRYKTIDDVQKRLELEQRIKDGKDRGRKAMLEKHPEINEAKQVWRQKVETNPFPTLGFLSK